MNYVTINKDIHLCRGGINFHGALVQGRYILHFRPKVNQAKNSLSINVIGKNDDRVIFSCRINMSEKRANKIMKEVSEIIIDNKYNYGYILPEKYKEKI